MKSAVATTVLLCAMTGPATAAPIYRCGNTYTQTPCPQGHVVEATDPRSGAQRAEAKRALAKEKQLAERMEQSRQQQETSPQAAGIGASVEPAATPVRAQKQAPKRATKRAHPAASSAHSGDKAAATTQPANTSR